MILFDSILSENYNVRIIRRRVGYVSQRTELLSGSVLDNLRYNNSDAFVEEIHDADRTAEIHDFITSLPNGYNTLMSENAVNFSESQKQRHSLARALIKKPDILILDEPNLSLDHQTEQSIMDNLPDAVRSKTTVTIAHRFSIIRSSDKVPLLSEEHTPVFGQHKILMNGSREYFRSVE